MQIGVLDSGVGGFSILAVLEQNFPQHSFVYLSDSKNFPYSEKTATELQEIGFQSTQKLLDLDCQIIVIACNTLTVTALTHLRASFPEIIFVGTVPAVKPAAQTLSPNSQIVVLATKNTAESEYLAALVAPWPAQNWTLIGPTKLVEVIENWDEQAIIAELERTLLPLHHKQPIEAVVLGCTHFPFVETYIEKVLDAPVIFFEPSIGIAKQLARAVEVVTARNTAEHTQVTKSIDEGSTLFYSTAAPATPTTAAIATVAAIGTTQVLADNYARLKKLLSSDSTAV